ncbi:MAG: type III pantothenate kinase, partial [Clostridia bacterium]|nr:type III pantothenate kinase [Clostridia bacterium]
LGHRADVDGCILSSVAPELTALIRPALEYLTGRPVLMADHKLDDGLVLVGYDRKDLGNDRVVDAVAALLRYPPPLAIFDLGTATTLSVLDGGGRFIGGMILAGMQLSANALAAQASQLPEIRLETPKALLGTDAVSCMQSGAVFGTAAQIDGLSERIEEQLGQPVTTVVTGGMSRLVRPYCRRPLQYDEHLLLKGLRYLYDRELRTRKDPRP